MAGDRSPCKGCSERRAATAANPTSCHGVCEKYKEFKELREEMLQSKHADIRMLDYEMRRILKAKKRNNVKKRGRGCG